MSKPRVLIAEDFVPLADALASWLAPWYEVVAKVNDLTMLQGAIRQTHPDVVLLDLAFKSFSALHELPALRKALLELTPDAKEVYQPPEEVPPPKNKRKKQKSDKGKVKKTK